MPAAHTNQNLILADIQLVEQCRDSKEGKQETRIKFQIFIFYSAFDASLPTKTQYYVLQKGNFTPRKRVEVVQTGKRT